MCWYLCSNHSSAFTAPQRAGNYSKRLLEVHSSRGAAWLMLHPLKELPQSSIALHFSDVEQQEASRQIPPASCGPCSNDRQAQPPCWWVWSAGRCQILNFFPNLIFVVARRYQYPEVCIPSVAYPDTQVALGVLSHQQKAPESDLSTNKNIINHLQTLPAFKESAGEKGTELLCLQKTKPQPNPEYFWLFLHKRAIK